MSNDLRALMPKILAQGLITVRENIPMSLLVNKDFSLDSMNRGDTVNVSVPVAMGDAIDVTPAVYAAPTADLVPTSIPIKLDQWKESPFTMTEKDLLEVDSNYPNRQIQEAARAISRTIEKSLLNLYKFVPNTIGTVGTAPFTQESGSTPFPTHMGIGAIRAAKNVLSNNLTPEQDRYIVLNPDAEANASTLPQFSSAANAGSNLTIVEGQIGRKFGFDWYSSTNIPVHTTTLAGSGAITASGSANLQGSVSLTVAGVTTAATPGDTFTIAGDPKPYSVLPGSTTGSLLVSPPLRRAFANGAVVTPVVQGASAQNLVFHRDAFALVVRTLPNSQGGTDRMVETFIDDVTGLPMRLEIAYQHKQWRYSFDVLYGVAALRPEMATRLLG